MKKIAYVLIIVGLLLIINSLSHSIIDLWSKQDLVKNAQLKLDQEKKENKELKNRLKIVQDRSFIESEARDKLFMVKPGEKEVILPSGTKDENKAAQNESEKENWQKWISLFFPSS